jgi:hypothetical protein
MAKIHFVMRGKPYTLTTDDVNAAMRGQTPGKIQDYATAVNGKWFSVRQVFASAIRAHQGLINTQVAVRQLRRLGYPIHSLKSDGPLPDTAPALPEASATDATAPYGSQALSLAVDLHKRRSSSPEDVLATAEAFRQWLSR